MDAEAGEARAGRQMGRGGVAGVAARAGAGDADAAGAGRGHAAGQELLRVLRLRCAAG